MQSQAGQIHGRTPTRIDFGDYHPIPGHAINQRARLLRLIESIGLAFIIFWHPHFLYPTRALAP
jgi:hypothetical protein